jgi:phosphoserine phosphatase RsbU/P
VLLSLNGILHGVLDGQFVTAACAHIDLQSRTVLYAGAGHPPVLLLRGAEVVELAENGLFLGPFKMAAYENLRTQFEPGDRLVAYTDGILEATVQDGEQFGAGRLREFAMAHRSAGPGQFAEALLNKVSVGEQEDDLTVMVVDCAAS